MVKQIQNIFKAVSLAVLGGILFTNCESEADNLGLQFFKDTAAQGTETPYEVIAYNVNNNDSIRADVGVLGKATLGAFSESNFGMQKSAYVTQLRLSSYSPDFGGANAVVDSVVLQIKPEYYTETDSVSTSTTESFTYNDVEAKKVLTTYKTKKYGKTKINNKTTFNIKVAEVTDYLYGIDKKLYSDQVVSEGAVLGQKTFDGDIRSVKITKKSDGTELLSRDAALRIPLDKDFFQNKIIAKKGSFELADAASFTRYFKGLRISVDETDGYLFTFNPNDVTLIMYYKYDNSATSTRTQATYSFDTSAANVRLSQISYNRPAAFTAAINSINASAGDSKLYVQGMGGPGARINIPATTIQTIKNLYNQNKVGIVSAKIRLYTDDSTWTSSFAKPSNFLVIKDGETGFIKDMTDFLYLNSYKLVNAVNLTKNPAYYDINITSTLKDIVEKEALNKDIIINVGDYLTSATGSLVSQSYNSRAYTPNRVVLVGTDATNANRAQLRITYAKK